MRASMPTRCSKLDEVVLKIAGIKHRLWRAVEQAGVVLDVLDQRRRTKHATIRLLRKPAKWQMRPPVSRSPTSLRATARQRGRSCPSLSIASARDSTAE